MMEMTPHEQNFYMQQQQQQQQQQPPQMFNQGQPPQQTHPHVNQQIQRSQYQQYPQMRMGYGMGGGYPRPHFQNEMNVNRNMLPQSEQNVSMNSNMYSMNPSLRRSNNQSHMYMNNNAPQGAQMNNMGPWEQALNEPYSPYNHYPATPNPQLHNQNMSLPHNQNSMVCNPNSQMQLNPNSQISKTPMSHNPTTAMSHQQIPSMPMQFSSLENPMSNFQTTASPSITRPNTSVSINSSFGNKGAMSHMQNMQQRLQQPTNPGSTGMSLNRHPPQYSEGLMKRLIDPNGGSGGSSFNNDDHKKLMPDIKLSPTVRGLSPNNNNNNNNSTFNLSKLDYIKKEENKDSIKDNKQPLTNLNAPSVTIKNEEGDDGLKCDSTETIPPGLLDTEEDFDLITKSLMEKSFDPFKELNAPNSSGQDILPQILSICKSPVPQDGTNNVSGTNTLPELHNLDAMSLSTSKNAQSGIKTPIISSAVTSSPNNNQFCSPPLGMQNIYNQLVNEKDDGRDSDTPNSSMCYSKDADSSPGSNCDTTQASCDKLAKFPPSCPTELTGNNMHSFNFEFDTDLNIFLPNYSNKPSDHNMNFCEKLLTGNNNNNNNEGSPENKSEQSNLTNMVPLSESNSDINNKAKASGGNRKGRNKSDSEFGSKPANNKRSKGSVKKGSRKSPYDCGNKNVKKVSNSSENKNSSDDTATSSTSTTTYISSPEPDKNSPSYNKLYFEKKSNYRFGKYLRQLTASVGEKTDVTETYPFKKLQNCEKVFLRQLSTPVMDSYIFDSLTPGVKSEKDIDLKYMTKRKITIYEDIPTDSIYEFIERSPTQPFQYLCPDNDRTQEPSQRLVALLQTK